MLRADLVRLWEVVVRKRRDDLVPTTQGQAADPELSGEETGVFVVQEVVDQGACPRASRMARAMYS